MAAVAMSVLPWESEAVESPGGLRNRDFICEFPDHILHLIVSKLTLRDAVRTSALSHKWKELISSSSLTRFDFTIENLRRDFSDDINGCFRFATRMRSKELILLLSCTKTYKKNKFLLTVEAFECENHYDLQGMVSYLVNLKALKFKDSGLPEEICLAKLRHLRYFVVEQCDNLKTIKFSNVNPQSLHCYSKRGIRLNASGVPNLTSLKYGVKDSTTNMILPCLPNEFSKLSRFVLLNMVDWICGAEDSQPIPEAQPIECAYEHLRTIKFGGFCGHRSQLEFVVHMLKHSVALKKMILKRRLRNHVQRGCESCSKRPLKWKRGEKLKVYKELHKVSHSAIVILQ
ncbi:hypothetical protein Tsubulata_011232 [Turnera subulata]|uniref:F-box domain-containing protein n=1 Tax=Turnera subulata TaxID=218843 RepID=A0A9Q0FP14_9ROSI|nr:hypothetical protein Tsubulata_011232 [Turnera subulata]